MKVQPIFQISKNVYKVKNAKARNVLNAKINAPQGLSNCPVRLSVIEEVDKFFENNPMSMGAAGTTWYTTIGTSFLTSIINFFS